MIRIFAVQESTLKQHIQKIFLSLILSFCYCLGFGQYHKLLDGFKEWSLLTCNGPNCIIDYYWTGSDTVLNGKTYTILEGYHFAGTVGVREDVANKQIFLKPFGVSALEPEVLTYDFTLQVGDSMKVVNTQAPVPEQSGYFTVDSIRMIDHFGVLRKTLYLSGNDTSKGDLNRAIWTEGLGSLSIINTPGLYPNEEGTGATNCAHLNGELIYRFQSGREDSCTTNYEGPAIGLRQFETTGGFVYPNPAQTRLNFTPSLKVFQVELLNMNGQILKRIEIEPHQQFIDVEFLPHGIYWLKMRLESEEIVHLKFSKL